MAPVMPLLVLNMGSEMAFVLDTQLRSKKTSHSRRLRVLRSLVLALHDRAFVGALFGRTDQQHQQPTALGLRALFGRLANAPTSLCVNARTMDTLYEAIRVGFKRQLLAAHTTLLSVTLNHLDATKRMVERTHDEDDDDGNTVRRLIDETILRTHDTYSDISVGEWYLLRQRLCHALQDRSAGKPTRVLPVAEQMASNRCGQQRTVVVRYFDDVGGVHEELALARLTEASAIPPQRPRYSTLGGRQTLDDDTNDDETNDANDPVRSEASIVADALGNGSSAASPPRSSRTFTATASDALDLLAELLASNVTAEAKSTDLTGWKFRPFGSDTKGGEEAEEDGDEERTVETRWLDARSDCKEMDALHDEWGAKASTVKGEGDDDDDLLRLMDAVVS